MVCPDEAFNLNSLAFRWVEFIGSESWDTQLWIFFLRKASALWVPSFLDLALRLFLPISMSIKAMNATKCIWFRTCNHDTRDDADNYTSIFFILPSIDKGFSAPIAGLAFRLFELFTSVCSLTFGTEEDACSRWDLLASPTSFHIISRCPVACVCRKLQLSLLEQDPTAFRWKLSPVFRSV